MHQISTFWHLLRDDSTKSWVVAFICFLLTFFSLLVFEKNASIHGSYTRLPWRLRQSDVFHLCFSYHRVPFDNHIWSNQSTHCTLGLERVKKLTANNYLKSCKAFHFPPQISLSGTSSVLRHLGVSKASNGSKHFNRRFLSSSMIVHSVKCARG